MSPINRNPAHHQFDHDRVPLVEHIQDLRSRQIVPYLSIGHRLGEAADPEIVALLGRDLFESNTWLTASAYDEAVAAAERLAAGAWSADRSFFLVDGSSAGNHAVLMATLNPGERVIISRDVHWSMMVAIIMTGAIPIYVKPDIDPIYDVGTGVNPAAIEAAITEHPEARLVVLVSPSWCGVSADLPAIADIAHRHGLPLYVDEAWGPHNHFHPDLPVSAMQAGADAAVMSVHKILPAVSQGSMLHLQGSRIDGDRLSTAVRMMSTTSPMLPIVASLDATRRQMVREGRTRLDRTIALARWARAELETLPAYELLSASKLSLPDRLFDETKFVIDVHRMGISGYEAEAILNRTHAIAVESADHRGIVANFNLGETEESAQRFVDALRSIAVAHPVSRRGGEPDEPRATGSVLSTPELAMTPRDAWFSRKRRIPLSHSSGMIAAELITPYPPGIPVLAPGEVIADEHIDYLQRVFDLGAVQYGTGKGKGERTISVVDLD